MATYYIDSDNGTNSYTGLKISGTIDSTASTTTFVDAALTGADDYINGSFFFNETTGHVSSITDFVAGTDTATIADADASMAGGDTYYILHAWVDLHQFTENARSPGDIVILRRGRTAAYDDGGDLEFTSDGTLTNPIIITADNANAFQDDVDLSATATATLTFGSKIITFASDISGVLATDDWIYADGDAADEFSYEVASVSTVTVTLFLPYKGAQAGSGKTMTNIQNNPKWSSVAAVTHVNLDTDNYWKFQGLYFLGDNNQGTFEVDSTILPLFKDCIFGGNGAGTTGIKFSDDFPMVNLHKCRFFNYQTSLSVTAGISGFRGQLTDCLFDGNSVSNSHAILGESSTRVVLISCELKNHALADLRYIGANILYNGTFILRNCILASTTEFDAIDVSASGFVFVEDHNNVLNDTRQLSYLSSGEAVPIIQSETTKVRSGGGTSSIKVTPSTDINSVWEYGRQLLLEYPIYATTSSKTYTVYFASDTTTEWTSNPTAVQLWIELEYWGHATNNFRRMTKSTGTVDFTTDTDFDQTLTVTIAPSQTGVAYLRCYYAKTKESGKTNIFYCDSKIEIT